MAFMLDEPFKGPDMRMEFECSCPTDDWRRDHIGDLNRPCVFVDLYEPDPAICDVLEKALTTSMRSQGNRYVVVEPESFEHPSEAGAMCYRVRIPDDESPRAWVAVQKPYVDAIERYARPDRWAWFHLPFMDDGRPRPPAIWAMRGEKNQAVGLIVPMICEGSALELATPTPEYLGEHEGHDAPDQQQPDDEPAWPPPSIEGEPVALPGFEDVPERPAERGGYPT